MLRYLVQAERTILIICNLAIMIIVVAAFLARYLFAVDFYGAEEILMIFAFWLYFIGGAIGSYERSHIEADFISAWLGDTAAARALGFLRDTIEIVVLFVLTYWSFLLVKFSIERWPITPGWKIPLLVPQSAITVGFVLMTLHALVHFWNRVQGQPLDTGNEV
jgi:TRAP-type C4-dicarboxylate transport system permease small subunit